MTDRCALLAVSAHPDDEAIHWGGTLARYAAAGVRVVCATATRGELGEIVDPSLATDRNYERLGEIRMDELAQAAAALGQVETRWLGYRDSGMAGEASNDDPDAFCRADLDEAAGRVARIIREIRPQVVITHRAHGGDDHPDHRRAAVITHLACERAGDPSAWPDQLAGTQPVRPWAPLKVYEGHGRTLAPMGSGVRLRLLLRERGLIAAVPALGRALMRRWRRRGSAQTVVAPAPVKATTRIDVGPWVAARDQAIRAHRTQVRRSDPLLALTPKELRRLSPTEDFILSADGNGSAREDDLFAGVSCDQLQLKGS